MKILFERVNIASLENNKLRNKMLLNILGNRDGDGQRKSLAKDFRDGQKFFMKECVVFYDYYAKSFEKYTFSFLPFVYKCFRLIYKYFTTFLSDI